MFIHVAAHETIILGAAFEHMKHRRAAQVEETIFQAQLLARSVAFVMSADRERFGAVHKFEFIDDNSEVAGFNVGVFEFGGTFADKTFGRDDEFIAQRFGSFESVDNLWSNDKLNNSLVVAEVDKDKAAMIAARIDPASHVDFLPISVLVVSISFS